MSKGQEEWNPLLQTLEGHSSSVDNVSFSPDDTLVASASSDHTIRLWDTATGSCRSTLEGHLDWINAVSFSPNNTLAASVSDNSTVRLWDTATGPCRMESCSSCISTLYFSPDGRHLDTSSGQIPFPFTTFEGGHDNNKNSSHLSVEDRWLSSASQRSLWLPPDYRSSYIAIHDDIVCLRHASGHITILQFKSNALP